MAVKKVDRGYFQPCETGLLLGPEDFGHATSRTPWLPVNFQGVYFFFENMTPTKVCPTCQIPKPLSEFGKSKKSKYGVQAHCKTCPSDTKA
jgi:hypothetical protein